MARSRPSDSSQSTATIGFEAKLSLAADELYNNLDGSDPMPKGKIPLCAGADLTDQIVLVSSQVHFRCK